MSASEIHLVLIARGAFRFAHAPYLGSRAWLRLALR
jgi:hypothetical protein